MNIILFETPDIASLPRSDPRAVHLLGTLKKTVGDEFDAGVFNDAIGKGRITSLDDSIVGLEFTWTGVPPPPDPIVLIVGLPRPQTARRILSECTSLGLSAIHFIKTENGDPGYHQSRLWRSDEWRNYVVGGAQQAFTTHLPEVTVSRTLAEVIETNAAVESRVALDNYEALKPLSSAAISLPVLVALGSERGWSAGERDLLRDKGFTMAHLGQPVLRLETACVAAVAIVKSAAGSM